MNGNVDLTGILLRTPRLILRPFLATDLDDFFAYASVPGVGEMAGWRHHTNREESKRILDTFIQENKNLALVDSEKNKVIGSLGMEMLSQSFYTKSSLVGREIGYVLNKDYWGQGLMPEAIRAVVQYCFSTQNFDFLAVSHFLDNLQSQKVIEKSRFSYDGEYFFKASDGTLKKAKYYSLLNPSKAVEKDW